MSSGACRDCGTCRLQRQCASARRAFRVIFSAAQLAGGRGIGNARPGHQRSRPDPRYPATGVELASSVGRRVRDDDNAAKIAMGPCMNRHSARTRRRESAAAHLYGAVSEHRRNASPSVDRFLRRRKALHAGHLRDPVMCRRMPRWPAIGVTFGDRDWIDPHASRPQLGRPEMSPCPACA